MRHAVIVGHPNPESFTLSVARTYCDAARARGDGADIRDLYAIGFDPRLQAHEIPGALNFAARKDAVAERERLAEADVFAFVYPLWFNAPPAMVKGYVERVFGMGFGYGPFSGGGNAPLLTGKKMITFSTSGAPGPWLQQQPAWAAIRELFDAHVAAVCGLTVLDHVHFGGIHAGMSDAAAQNALTQVRDRVGQIA